MKMKKLRSALLLAGLLGSASAVANDSVFNINTTLSNGQEVDVTFDLGLFYNIPAISYYADNALDSHDCGVGGAGTFTQSNNGVCFEKGDGYVNSGEFVFDAATGKIVNRLMLGDEVVAQQSTNAPGNDPIYGQMWNLSFDYALYGTAAIVDTETGELTDTYDDFGYTNGVPNQVLAADIQGGIINVFFNDKTNDKGGHEEDALLMSLTVTGSEIFGGGPSPAGNLTPGITLNAEMNYVLDSLLYKEGGNLLVSDALANGAVGTMSLTTEVEEDNNRDGVRDDGTIPGQYDGSVATINEDGLQYINPGWGSTTPAGRIINEINDWGTCDPSFYDSGNNNGQVCNDALGSEFASNNDLIPSEVDGLARDVIDLIKDSAGNNMILARTTSPEATFTMNVSEPASIALFGLSLAGMGALRRRKKS